MLILITLLIVIILILVWKYINLKEIEKFNKFTRISLQHKIDDFIIDMTNIKKGQLANYGYDVIDSKMKHIAQNDLLEEFREKHLKEYKKLYKDFEEFYGKNISFKEELIDTRETKIVHYIINSYYHVIITYVYNCETSYTFDRTLEITLYKIKK